MNTKNITIAIVALIVLVIGGVWLTQPATVVVDGQPVETNRFGALSGPDIISQYLSVGGVRREYRQTSMVAATTTLCAMQAPAATSTLVSTSFQITTGTSTAATIDVGTSTTAFATTTNLVTAKSIGSGAQGYAYWTSVGGAVNDNIMAPSEYVVVKTAGAGLSGYTYGGRCQATFEVL